MAEKTTDQTAMKLKATQIDRERSKIPMEETNRRLAAWQIGRGN